MRCAVLVGALWALLALADGLAPGPAAGQAGRVAGEVIYVGRPPDPGRSRPVTRNVETCGTEYPVEDLIIAGGRLANAALAIEPPGRASASEDPVARPGAGRPESRPRRGAGGGAAGGKPAPAALDQKGCRFAPRVLAVPVGGQIRLLNPDGALHAVQIVGSAARLEVATPPGRTETLVTLSATFDRPEVLAVRCGVHPWMTAYVVLTEGPHAAVTDTAGRFTLHDVPAGRHVLSFWHERLGRRTFEVVVKAGETATVTLRVGETRSP